MRYIGIVFNFTFVILLSSSYTYSCTIFASFDGKTMMVGNNEDNTPTLKSYVWYHPSTKGNNGYVTWGNVKKFPEGGMNDKGLFWDAAAMPKRIAIVKKSDRKNFKGYFVDKALSECATVAQLIDLLSKYNLIWQEKAQIFVADATGDYAIIHANYIIRKSDLKVDYFSLSNYCINDGSSTTFQCHRQGYAHNVLKNNTTNSLALFKSILQKTSQTHVTNATIYSQVCNLNEGAFYLYQNNDFNHERKIVLLDELKKGERTVDMQDYFPLNISKVLKPLYLKNDYSGASSTYFQYVKSSKSEYNFSFRALDELGFEFLRDNKKTQAVEVFMLNLSQHPNSDDAHASLACAYMSLNDTDNAKKYFMKAKAINPDNYMSSIFMPEQPRKIVFKVKHFEGVEKMSIAGTFNDFKPNINTFKKDNEGNWICEVEIAPGEHRYKFVVGDGNWYADPFNKYMIRPEKIWDNYLKVE